MKTYIGKIEGQTAHVGIVVSQFNDLVTKKLLEGATESLKQYGVKDNNLITIWVPGAFELPRAAKLLANSGKVDGVIALGAVIRGETDHYDYVCSSTAQGIAEVSLNSQVPVMFGVLTTDTLDQAINRAGGKGGNKGADCASGMLQMIHLGNLLS